MTLRSPFLSAALKAGIHTSYYALCDAHPLNLDAPKVSLAAKAVLGAAAGHLPLEKLRGPGAVYKLVALPEGMELNFILLGRDTVDTHFRISTAEAVHESSFAILSKNLLQVSGAPDPDPPYPRPSFYSMAELIGILQEFDRLVRTLGSAVLEDCATP